MSQRRENVKCTICGWRSKRVFKDCECYDLCSHSGYGHCPRCKALVERTQVLVAAKKAQEEYKKWAGSPEGKEVLAKFSDGHRRKVA